MEDRFLKIAGELSRFMTGRNLTLSLAESCTGGLVSHTITNIPGASRFFELSVVSYSPGIKHSVLGVRQSVLDRHGTVSEETAVAMAEAVRKIGKTDVALSITGVAGPEPLEGKDPGIVYVAAAFEGKTEAKGFKVEGGRETVKREACFEALRFLMQVLDVWA